MVLVISFITAGQPCGLVLAAVAYAFLTAAPLLLQEKKGKCLKKDQCLKTQPVSIKNANASKRHQYFAALPSATRYSMACSTYSLSMMLMPCNQLKIKLSVLRVAMPLARCRAMLCFDLDNGTTSLIWTTAQLNTMPQCARQSLGVALDAEILSLRPSASRTHTPELC
jgi:hypothetical protein